jgi:hypothetical protein
MMSTNISHASRMTAPSYDDDVRRGRFCCTQECNERIAGDDLGTAANAAQFRNRIHLLVEDSAGFAPLDLDQARRLVIVHHVHEHELALLFLAKRPARKAIRDRVEKSVAARIRCMCSTNSPSTAAGAGAHSALRRPVGFIRATTALSAVVWRARQV